MNSLRDGALAPLREPAFRRLWLGTTAAHTGYWAQSVAVAWWLVEHGYGPQVIALAHFSSSLPVLMLSYVSGWLIDRFDYLTVQRISQGWTVFASTALVALLCLDSPSPQALLLLTGLMGAGVALRNPAWQAGIGQIVPLRHLSAAIVLSSVAFNLARAVGPLIAGLLISVAGVGAAFAYNAITALGLFVVLQQLPASVSSKPGRAVAASAPVNPDARRWLRSLCLRAMGMGLPTSVLLALLPVVASSEHQDPHRYVWLLAAFGTGGLVAALIRPRLIRMAGPDRLLNICNLVLITCMLFIAWRPHGHLLGPVAVAGASWLMLFSTLNVAVHTHAPASYRGRALAAYMTSAFGGMAAGGLLWGWLAQLWHSDAAMLIAAMVLAGLHAFFRPRVCSGY